MPEFQSAVVIVVAVGFTLFAAFYFFASFVDSLAEISAEEFEKESAALIERLNKIK